MEGLDGLQKAVKAKYDSGQSPLSDIQSISTYCLKKLQLESSEAFSAQVGSKEYVIYKAAGNYTRPCRRHLFISSPEEFGESWEDLLEGIDPEHRKLDIPEDLVNRLIYTVVFSFSACYDLWKPKSRKTPGTYFEVLLGSMIGVLLPDFVRSKFIAIPGEDAKVSTDIVFKGSQESHGLVVASKITTRERIVQPYAHQRILDSVFGMQSYKSVLACVSETQRSGTDRVREICVPGTIRLFQSHLAALTGLYYLDAPTRYLQSDVTSLVPVKSVGKMLVEDLPGLV